MKKVLFSVLMISAMFVLASCGSKSNSNEPANSPSTESKFNSYEPADPPFTYSKAEAFYENIPLEGVFEMQKVALSKVKGKIYYSSQLSGEGDCLVITINLKMINDYSQRPESINGYVQLLNKDEAVLLDKSLAWNCSDLISLDKGGLGIITYTTSDPYINVDEMLANVKYIRIRGFNAWTYPRS